MKVCPTCGGVMEDWKVEADTNGNYVTDRCPDCNSTETVHHLYPHHDPSSHLFKGRRSSEPEPAPPEPNPTGLCQCGCGEPAPVSKKNDNRLGYLKGQSMRFIHGHGRRKSFGRF